MKLHNGSYFFGAFAGICSTLPLGAPPRVVPYALGCLVVAVIFAIKAYKAGKVGR